MNPFKFIEYNILKKIYILLLEIIKNKQKYDSNGVNLRKYAYEK